MKSSGGTTRKHYYLKKATRKVASLNLPEIESAPVSEVPAVQFNVRSRRHEDLMGTLPAPLSGGVAVISMQTGWLSGVKWIGAFVVATLVTLSGLVVNEAQAKLTDQLTGQVELGLNNLQSGAESLKQGNYDEAVTHLAQSENILHGTLNDMWVLGQGTSVLSHLPYYHNSLNEGQKLVMSGWLVAKSAHALATSMQTFSKDLEATGGTSNEDMGVWLAESASRNAPAFNEADKYAKEALALFNETDTSKLPGSYGAQVTDAKKEVELLAVGTNLIAGLANNAQDILGFKNPRSYLVLLENNRELRPTGGFIGSYAKVDIEEGKLTGVKVLDVYDLDGQIGYSPVSLPAPLASVAGDKGLGFRDANWNPDFPTSTHTLEELYQKGGGGSVQGIVAVTPEVISKFLDILGPISLPDQNLTLTKDNFVDLLQTQIEVNAKDPSHPKQILADVQPVLMDRLFKARPAQVTALNKALAESLAEKQILMYFKNPDLASLLGQVGWDGSQVLPAAREDSVSIVRANLGGKKSSAQTFADYSYLANINKSGEVLSSLTMSFTNRNRVEFPYGDNKDYVRVYAPSGSILQSVNGNDPATDIDVTQENGFTVFGFWVTTPTGSLKEVVLNYKLPWLIKAGDTYKLLLQKQAGTLNQTLTVKIQQEAAGQSTDLRTGSWDRDERLSLKL
jgi:hypothetical protein